MDTNEEYYIGLDGGTDSVGWAVVRPDYTVIKKSGKALWGVRLFEMGSTAAERRQSRSARRRTDRRKWRLKLLREMFDQEISFVDQSFFLRLNESKYWEDDKKVDGADSLFHDADFTDKDYHKKYPTIYHLRNYLINCDEKPDIRLVYLAIAHIIKHRGHFLNEGQQLDSARSFDGVWNNLCASAEDILEIVLPQDIKDDVASALLDAESGVKEKSKKLEGLFGKAESDEETLSRKRLAELLAGAKTAAADIFNDESIDKSLKISFKDKSIEELETDFADSLGTERFAFLGYAYSVYNWAVFARILPEGRNVSAVKVEEFDRHQDELKKLKAVVKKYAPESYSKVFRSATEKSNYSAYIGGTKCGSKKVPVNHCSGEDFYKFLEKELKKVWEQKDEDPVVSELYKELKDGNLLPKQVSKENSVFPYQVHLEELRKILENMKRFYPFLTASDENGYSTDYKIEKLLTFRIPYYVGPLNDAHKDKGFCWIVKKQDVPVLPWNFEDVVDENASEDAFIGRMTSTCTYLVGEDVLPQNSELYCRFMVLNELNNLRIRDEKISVELKQKIFNDLFMTGTGAKVTNKKLVNYLKSQGYDVTKDDISGIDGDFKSSMAPVLKLKNILADYPLDNEKLEELIFSLTVSGDSPKMLEKRVRKVIGNSADKNTIRKICSTKITGWGRLSKKFLTGIYHVDKKTGECQSIMQLLWETKNNLMQLLSKDYEFLSAVEDFNKEQNDADIKYDYDHLVKDLYVSPAVKRSLWQTLLVVKEIKKIMGHDPARIFIEMARGAAPDQKNKRTVSRKARLLELYKSCEDDTRDWCKEIDALPEDKLRSDKLYLYYTQMGRCMYSGEKINLLDLMHDGDSNRLYDIDHIYPQSKVKDDSLDNRVLVKRSLNGQKTDIYPLPEQMRQSKLWYSLWQKGFISHEKYYRLTRKTPFTDQELAGFINRQLVETRQSTKAAAEILKVIFPKSDIVYVKAGLASEFRHEFDFVKCRDANDFHHAKDAYLNVVVGNVYHEKFTKDVLRFVKSGAKYNLRTGKLFADTIKKDRVIWEEGKNGSIKTVRERMVKNDPMVTRYVSEAKGALYDLMPVKKGKGQLPLKSSDPRLQNIERYGGYNKLKGAYFALVAYEKKKKRVKSVEFVPLYKVPEFKKNPEAMKAYFSDRLGVEKVDILIPEIKMGTLFRWNGVPLTLAGRSDNRLLFRIAAELHTTQEQEKYIKKISKYLERAKGRKDPLEIIPEYDKLTKGENLRLYDQFTNLLLNSVYAKRLSAQGEFLKNKREKFTELSAEVQVQQLFEILHFFQCNPVKTNLKSLGGADGAGEIKSTKNLDSKDTVFIVNQSVTGFFSNEVCLNDL